MISVYILVYCVLYVTASSAPVQSSVDSDMAHQILYLNHSFS